MNLFPEEIIKHTTEHLHANHSQKSNVIYMVVLFFIVISGVLAPLLKINITKQSRGIIRSEIENNYIQTSVGGRIVISNLHENKKVKTGDTLLVIEANHLKERFSNYHQKITLNLQFISDIEKIIKDQPYSLATTKYNSERDEYLAQINQQKSQSEYLLYLKKISDDLFEKKVETKVDNKRIQNDYIASIKKEKYIHDQYRRKWNAELVMLQQEILEINTQVTQLEEEIKKHTIISPIDGEIIQVAGIQTGIYVPAGFQLAQISPQGTLIAECFVTPYDIGFFHEGMHANFQLDAFNYNQWGMAKGIVKEISSDIINVNNQPVFKVRCSIETTHLQLKTGYKSEIKKGMTFTGRFTLTQRTIAQLLFDKLDNWLNPKLVNN